MEKDGEVILWTREKNSQPDSQQPSTSSTDVDDVPAIRRPPGKRAAHNIARGPTREARVIANEIQAWELFFTDKILENIVRYSNMNIDRYIERNEDKIDFKKHTHVKRVDVMEMRAFIGILYLRAAMKMNIRSTEEMFLHESSPDIFQATMSYKRYYFLIRLISFGASTQADRFKIASTHATERFLKTRTREMQRCVYRRRT